MKVKVVFWTGQGEQTVYIENVDTATYNEESKVLELSDSNENSVGDFREWNYWLKVE
jgi:hypothetical protein